MLSAGHGRPLGREGPSVFRSHLRPPLEAGLTDPTPVGTSLLRQGRRLCEGASLLTPFVAILALWTSVNQLGEARRSARVKPIGDIIAQSTEITMWMANYPEVAPYFQA